MLTATVCYAYPRSTVMLTAALLYHDDGGAYIVTTRYWSVFQLEYAVIDTNSSNGRSLKIRAVPPLPTRARDH